MRTGSKTASFKRLHRKRSVIRNALVPQTLSAGAFPIQH